MKRICLLAFAAAMSATPLFSQVLVGTPSASPTPSGVGIPDQAAIPRVVASKPANGDLKVNPSTTLLKIQFSEPMDTATFYWPIDQSQPYAIQMTGDPYWDKTRMILTVPVKLTTKNRYQVPINQNNNWAFRSAKGVYCNPGYITFETATGSSGGASAASMGYTPAPSNLQGYDNTQRQGSGMGSTSPSGTAGTSSASGSAGFATKSGGGATAMRTPYSGGSASAAQRQGAGASATQQKSGASLRGGKAAATPLASPTPTADPFKRNRNQRTR